MYENLTVESIKNDMLSRMSTDINTSEGSFANDMISAVAYEIWKSFQALDAIVPIAYVDETSGEYIDKRCSEYGIIRKSGTKAKAVLKFSGTDGTVIAKGKVFLTAEGLQFETEESVTIAGGTAQVSATAVGIGEKFNVAAGAIKLQLVSLNGLTAVKSEAAAGGTDEEKDSALVKRLYDYLQNPATSGNAAHYRQWALSVDGVGAAKITPNWKGAGTVKVLIVGNDNDPVDALIVKSCSDYIEANRPIGVTVTVESAEGLAINVAATVSIDSFTTIATVSANFKKALNEYLQSIAFSKYTISYNRIAYMLLDIEGVSDYSSLTINNGTSNISIGDNQVPVVGIVEVRT